ncbi:helix-turn-helix transcriptional regulator [Pelotomaculum propionicicum]|uniref:HTH-type transcriptional regulator Xre n=1 Tax=Pelotomaculum propionicicum TaxID=258475 RepID=A0A4Y7RWN5_9FIRM|nr:helix-turn-helix transcriptional regulator [Pelotomaculum propionicicum]TEB13418.1 HTH-type transcriptional regulator Xre [Pelotomaculum propionicicum]
MRQRLIGLREKSGFTQEEVAKKVGVSRSFYGLIETGTRNPTYGLAKKIAEFFEVDVEVLFLDLEGYRMKPLPRTSTGTEGGV